MEINLLNFRGHSTGMAFDLEFKNPDMTVIRVVYTWEGELKMPYNAVKLGNAIHKAVIREVQMLMPPKTVNIYSDEERQ